LWLDPIATVLTMQAGASLSDEMRRDLMLFVGSEAM
jgi:hypothetical protein